MPLTEFEVLHVFEAGEKRSEVQFMGGHEGNLRYRVIYMRKKHDGQSPDYFTSESYAVQVARGWAYHP